MNKGYRRFALAVCCFLMLVSGCLAEAPVGPQPQKTAEVKGYVVLSINGRQYGDPIPMDRDKVITIRQDKETVNKIHITPDSVEMIESNCEGQDCVGEGIVTLENYRTRILSTYIICLPHNLTVELIPVEEAQP